MMPSSFYFRNKVPVAVLQATKPLGQSYIASLSNHSWFAVCELFDQDDFAGLDYGSVLSAENRLYIIDKIKQLKVKNYSETSHAAILFDGLGGEQKDLNAPLTKPGAFLLTPYPYPEFATSLIIPEINGEKLDARQTGQLKTLVYPPDWIRDVSLLNAFLKDCLKVSQLAVEYAENKTLINFWKKVITPNEMEIAYLPTSEMDDSEILLSFFCLNQISQEGFTEEYARFVFQSQDYTYASARKKYENHSPQMIKIEDFQGSAATGKYQLKIACREGFLESGLHLAQYLIKKGKVFW